MGRRTSSGARLEEPASAFDGDPSTFWVASVSNDSVGQWVSINFGRLVRMSTITVTPLDDGPSRPRGGTAANHYAAGHGCATDCPGREDADAPGSGGAQPMDAA